MDNQVEDQETIGEEVPRYKYARYKAGFSALDTKGWEKLKSFPDDTGNATTKTKKEDVLHGTCYREGR